LRIQRVQGPQTDISEQEKAKKMHTEERVVQAEKGSFVPLIFTTSRGMGPLCNDFIKQLVEKLAYYKNERTLKIM
jgi:hypothetical protein